MQKGTFNSSKIQLDKNNELSCNSSGYCVHDPFPIHNTTPINSSCQATFINKGFTDFTVHPVDCNASHYVAVFCENELTRNKLQHNRSDVIISHKSSKGFTTLTLFQSCKIGWFRVNDLCIRFLLITSSTDSLVPDAIDVRSETNNKLTDICEQYNSTMAKHLFDNITFIDNSSHQFSLYTIPEESELSKFFSLFLHKTRISHEVEYSPFGISIDSSKLPITDLYIKAPQLVHRLSRRSREYYIWSLGRNIEFTNNKVGKLAYVLCERALEVSSNSPVKVGCSEHYNQCDDETCIHDGLWCDGFQHCSNGEDERNCDYICSLPDINCITGCHIEEHCHCIDTYFQCLSGGCVPLQKLCDKTVNCDDGSDEPPSCVYTDLQPVIGYINDLIADQKEKHENGMCFDKTMFQGDFGFSRKSAAFCPPRSTSFLTEPAITLGLCIDTTRDVGIQMTSDYAFPMYKLCIHDRECDKTCSHMDYVDKFFHLVNCKHFFCAGHFKCPFSYCVSLEQVCDGVCQCSMCEDENFCEKLLCPGLVLVERFTPLKERQLYCSREVLTLKGRLNRRQMIKDNAISVGAVYF